MTIDRSDEVKSSGVDVHVRWRTPMHLWLYCSLMGLPPTAMTMPGHDPPVAWRAGGFYAGCIDVVVCPSKAPDEIQVGYIWRDWPVPVLDAEPGQRP